MFHIACDWTFLSLHIFVEIKLDLISFRFLTLFKIHFDTSPTHVPLTVNPYPPNNQGEWNWISSIHLLVACIVCRN